MTPALNRMLLRLGRWPRRLAVLCCLVLAVSSAVDSRPSSPAAVADPLAPLRTGQVAVPVTLNQGGTDGVIRVGDHVGLLTADRVIADQLLVLRVSEVSLSGDGTATILVAADRPTALQIARFGGQGVLAVVDKSP